MKPYISMRVNKTSMGFRNQLFYFSEFSRYGSFAPLITYLVEESKISSDEIEHSLTFCRTAPSFFEDLENQPKITSRGGSVIVSPMGKAIAGPLWNKEGILYADLDLAEVVKGKMDFDIEKFAWH